MTGSAVPEQKAAEADIVTGVDSIGEGEAAPESSTPLKTKGAPETVATKNTGSMAPEETLTDSVPEEANIRSQPVAEPDKLGVKGLPAGETGATGKLNLDLGVY